MSFLLDSIAAIIAGVFMGLIVAYFYVKYQNARLFNNKARILAKLAENKFIIEGKPYDIEKELEEGQKPEVKEAELPIKKNHPQRIPLAEDFIKNTKKKGVKKNETKP